MTPRMPRMIKKHLDQILAIARGNPDELAGSERHGICHLERLKRARSEDGNPLFVSMKLKRGRLLVSVAEEVPHRTCGGFSYEYYEPKLFHIPNWRTR